MIIIMSSINELENKQYFEHELYCDIIFKVTHCRNNISCFKSFFQLYHENNASDEVIKVLQAAFSKYPNHVNHQGELHFVVCFSKFSLLLCSVQFQIHIQELKKKLEEHAHTSVMAAKYLRLKVAEKKVEKMKLCYDGKNLTLFKVTESSAVFSHLRQVPCFSLSNSLDQSKTVVVYQKILLY